MEELDLKELFEIFWSKKIHIVICIIIFMLIGIIYTYAFTTPKYKSETTLLVVQQNNFGESTGQGITTTDLTLNQKLVPTYSELIKSKTVVRQVIENLKLDIDEDALKSSITVSSVKDTELIQITVTNLNAKIARDVANELVPVFADVVKDKYNVDNVNVIDAAELEDTPYNINHLRDIIIFALVGIVVSVIYVLIMNMLDTTIKNKEDVEKATGLIVLTELPIVEFKKTKKEARN